MGLARDVGKARYCSAGADLYSLKQGSFHRLAFCGRSVQCLSVSSSLPHSTSCMWVGNANTSGAKG